MKTKCTSLTNVIEFRSGDTRLSKSCNRWR